MPLVSVVIPTYRSAKSLPTCLDSILKQSYPNIEIVVVDNCSEDGVEQICLRSGAKFYSAKTSMTQARNLGTYYARGDFILSLDSDMELERHVIKECVQLCTSDSVQAVVIPEISVAGNFWANCIALEKRSYFGDPLVEAARFFRRDVLIGIGGYDESLVAGEDNDVHFSLIHKRCKISRVNAHIINHDDALRTILVKKFKYGRTLSRYIRKRGVHAIVVFAPLRPAWIRQYRTVIRNPLLAAGIIVLRLAKSLAAVLGMIVSAILG